MPNLLLWSLDDVGAASLNQLFNGTFNVSGTGNGATFTDDETNFDDFFGNGGQTQDSGLNQTLTQDLVIDGVVVGNAGDEIYNAGEGDIFNATTGQTGRIIYVTLNGGTVNEYVAFATTIPIGPGDQITTSNLTPLATEPYANLIPCFATGTLINTPVGRRRVQDLTVGDMILTRDRGPQPIRWIGSRALSLDELATAPALWPVHISAGALGPATPDQELIVSPEHRVLIDSSAMGVMFGISETLVSARSLLSKTGVSQPKPTSPVTYFHILFDAHEVIVSNGAATESFHPSILPQSVSQRRTAEELATLFPDLPVFDMSWPMARPALRARESGLISEADPKIS